MIEVHCGPQANGKPQRTVVVRNCDGREYTDKIDTDSGFQRQSLLERAAKQFDIDLEDLKPLDREICRQAGMEDQRGGDSFKTVEFKRITCKELDAANYDLEYLIDGALVAGQPCILAGGKKTLKTSRYLSTLG